MFDLINGIPLHPLVVHGVVVLLPLAILGTIAIAARRRWRTAYGPLVVAVAAVATVLIPVSTQSGEALEKRVGRPGDHAEQGDLLIWFTLPLLILVVALVVLDRAATRRAGSVTLEGTAETTPPARSSKQGPATTVVAVLAVVASLAAGVQVYRVGDSGAQSAWGDKVGTK